MDLDRRLIVGAAAALVAAAPSRPQAGEKPAARPGDFDFLAGEWKIRQRRLKGPGQWDEFDGEATCWTILGGVGSVEELRIPSRDFSGLGLRLLDVKQQVWVDHWVNAKSGVLALPGMSGVFVDGDGVFTADDEEDGKPVKYRGLWDQIRPGSHRWSQSVSRDGGRTWDDNWVMQWSRA
ncbi:MAG: hypothetical protein JNK30_03395 [Phenylobacterium sp.]|uniref:hypothetical protein n=1 Tax=Phenylobacterium sp. TaxID=1871053 RepID=UPI001A3C45DB|nr:hypothetical protein [Phenylobacterium sp.]MBL8770402.1 hypothetical protein [Phenylobacterium sp.]